MHAYVSSYLKAQEFVMKIAAIIGFIALATLATPAFALTTESAPVDAHGVAYTDPDDQVDMQNTSSSSNGTQGYQFGGGNSSVWVGSSGAQGSPDNVLTGGQMFDPARNGGYALGH
jgi:hypothetical protein